MQSAVLAVLVVVAASNRREIIVYCSIVVVTFLPVVQSCGDVVQYLPALSVFPGQTDPCTVTLTYQRD